MTVGSPPRCRAITGAISRAVRSVPPPASDEMIMVTVLPAKEGPAAAAAGAAASPPTSSRTARARMRGIFRDMSAPPGRSVMQGFDEVREVLAEHAVDRPALPGAVQDLRIVELVPRERPRHLHHDVGMLDIGDDMLAQRMLLLHADAELGRDVFRHAARGALAALEQLARIGELQRRAGRKALQPRLGAHEVQPGLAAGEGGVGRLGGLEILPLEPDRFALAYRQLVMILDLAFAAAVQLLGFMFPDELLHQKGRFRLREGPAVAPVEHPDDLLQIVRGEALAAELGREEAAIGARLMLRIREVDQLVLELLQTLRLGHQRSHVIHSL